MDIYRRGSQRNRGTTTLLSDLRLTTGSKYKWSDTVQWDAASKKMVISAGHVPLGDGRTCHNYKIQLTLDDVTALITLLGHAGSAENAALLRDRLAKDIPALVKLLACATGLSPEPIEEQQKP